MPDIVLDCGQSVTLDDEDYDWAVQTRWYVRDRPDRSRRIINDEKRGGRIFRIFLHRAIAVRMRPDLVDHVARMKVRAINGDYTDVRRANLEIKLAKKIRKKSKSEGSIVYALKHHFKRSRLRDYIDVKYIPRDHSPLWAGGFSVQRTRAAAFDGSRVNALVFAGRVVIDENGPCRGVLRSGDGRHVDDNSGGGDGDEAGSKVQLRGKIQGG